MHNPDMTNQNNLTKNNVYKPAQVQTRNKQQTKTKQNKIATLP